MRTSIDIFTRTYCEACEKAKAQITASAPETHGVTFNVHDAAEDPSIKSVPLIFIGDEPQISGFNASAIDQALSNLYALLVSTDTPPEEQPPEPPAPEPVVIAQQDAPIQVGGPSRTAVVFLAVIAGIALSRLLSSR